MAVLQVGDPPVDPKVMLAEMRREQEYVQWIKDNMRALVKKYGTNFAPVCHQHVIAAPPRLGALPKSLEKQGVASGSATIEALTVAKINVKARLLGVPEATAQRCANVCSTFSFLAQVNWQQSFQDT